MKRLAALVLAGALAAPAPPAFAKFNSYEAEEACKREARDQYGAHGFYGVLVRNEGRGRFVVTGVAERRGRDDVRFNCLADDERVVRMTSEGSGGGGSGDAGKAAAIVAGALIGAAVLGAISKDHKHDDHRRPRDSHDHREGWNDRFSPGHGVTCHRGQRACYNANGTYSSRHTRRAFR